MIRSLFDVVAFSVLPVMVETLPAPTLPVTRMPPVAMVVAALRVSVFAPDALKRMLLPAPLMLWPPETTLKLLAAAQVVAYDASGTTWPPEMVAQSVGEGPVP